MMKNYIDVKMTIWGRYTLPDDIEDIDIKRIINRLEEGEHLDKVCMTYPFEYLTETSESIAEGDSTTIECYKDNKLIHNR